LRIRTKLAKLVTPNQFMKLSMQSVRTVIKVIVYPHRRPDFSK
jgi:hypothetical protein